MSTDKKLFDTENLDTEPLNEFSGCHATIVSNFGDLKSLLRLLREAPESSEVRQLAKQQLAFFRDVVFEHHAEEEQALFTAVMECAEKGEEADQARQAVRRLVAEHRQLEASWAQLEPAIRRLAKGRRADLDIEQAEDLAMRYMAHAAYEEQYFLPLSARILSRNEMSALGLALHMRHQDEDSVGNYI